MKRRETSSARTVPSPGAELHVDPCKARRFCGKQARGALRQAGTQRDGENSSPRGRADRRGSTSMLVTSNGFLSLTSPRRLPPPSRGVRAKIPLCFFPGHSQRDFPQSAFDINAIPGVAVSARTAVGLHGKSNQHTLTVRERECVCACVRVGGLTDEKKPLTPAFVKVQYSTAALQNNICASFLLL